MEVLSNIPPLHGDKCPLVMTTNVGHLESLKKVWIIPTNVQEKKVRVMDGHAVRAARVYHHVQGGPGDVQGHAHHCVCVVPME